MYYCKLSIIRLYSALYMLYSLLYSFPWYYKCISRKKQNMSFFAKARNTLRDEAQMFLFILRSNTEWQYLEYKIKSPQNSRVKSIYRSFEEIQNFCLAFNQHFVKTFFGPQVNYNNRLFMEKLCKMYFRYRKVIICIYSKTPIRIL